MKYPFTKCLNPRRIVNKYTGDIVEVGCGVCKACLMARAQRMATLCSIEEQDHLFCLFVTLTYSDEFIPRMRAVIDEKHGVTRYYSKCERLGELGELIAVDMHDFHHSSRVFANPRAYYDSLHAKCKLDGDMSYLSVRDSQLFIKRFRKNLKKYSDEKVRYYICGEYGPKTFRAHFHVLFFYDTQETAASIAKVLRESWTFGRIDSSLSRGKVTSYVARYVNCTYYIPYVLGSLSSKPFSNHSQRFAQKLYLSKKAEIYEDPVDNFVKLGRVLSGSYVEFMPWRSLAATFFPKCRGYANKSHDQLLASYSILRKVEAAFGTAYDSLGMQSIAENIADMVLQYELFGDKEYRRWNHSNMAVYYVAKFFYNSVNPEYVKACRFDMDANKSFVNSILSDLYISQHFIRFVCDGNDVLFSRRVTQIENYWNYRDNVNLKKMYCEEQEFIDLYPSGLIDWFYYNRVIDDELLMKETVYQNFVIDVVNRFEKSLKHKIQNDINCIFING